MKVDEELLAFSICVEACKLRDVSWLLKQEIIDWFLEHAPQAFHNGGDGRYLYRFSDRVCLDADPVRFFFEDKNKSILFKLRWG